MTDTLILLATWAAIVIVALVAVVIVVALVAGIYNLTRALFFRPVKTRQAVTNSTVIRQANANLPPKGYANGFNRGDSSK